MNSSPVDQNLERLLGIVERVTYHNEQNGWSVLKVSTFRDPGSLSTVLVHQVKVYAGATMEFWGSWTNHPKFGEQFKAIRVVEKKPSTAAALEKYLGSGLIKGVGPAIARRIVSHFNDKTLEVFEGRIEDLKLIPGIAGKKLEMISSSWQEHKAIRDVMIFLQNYGISTLFATKIFKTYRDKAIEIVSKNPYRLAQDIYGIGFFSADRIALSMGFDPLGEPRIEAGIKHVLAASREEGHCYLTDVQIYENTLDLLQAKLEMTFIQGVLNRLIQSDQIKSRGINSEVCYYSKSLYFDEQATASQVIELLGAQVHQEFAEKSRIDLWVKRYSEKEVMSLSAEQTQAICQIPRQSFSILTGGPGCGKTTCTRVLVKLLKAMGKRVILAAPTGRASQRMTEVIGLEAKTIHRLLEWMPAKNGFSRNRENPLQGDFLIVDEASMLDISLTACLLKAVPAGTQVLLIGDPDQLPSVGAGNVLEDLLKSVRVPRFRLTQVFRQAKASTIIRYAHEINAGVVPRIESPIAHPEAFRNGVDCLFLDADEATQDQIKFIQRVRWAIDKKILNSSGGVGSEDKIDIEKAYVPAQVTEESVRSSDILIPEKFKHVNLEKLIEAQNDIDELRAVLKRVHPWSTLHHGLTALDTVVRLSTKTIPEWLGSDCEIQVLTPQVRGTLGSLNLNVTLQRARNPESPLKKQLQMGAKVFRLGDRVIQTRNNYDLGVFNGDIGTIVNIDNEDMICEVRFTGGDGRTVSFEKQDLSELALAYAITVHKSQGSEFPVVIIPVLSQHYNMLFRNLVYTGLTRARKLAIFVGNRKSLAMAISRVENRHRQTALTHLLQ